MAYWFLLFYITPIFYITAQDIPIEPRFGKNPKLNLLWTEENVPKLYLPNENQIKDKTNPNNEPKAQIVPKLRTTKDLAAQVKPGQLSWLADDQELPVWGKNVYNNFGLGWDAKPQTAIRTPEDLPAENFKAPDQPNPNATQEDIVKNKLLGLIQDSKLSIDKKLSAIDTVHKEYNSYKLYKMGYIVSFINKTHDSLKDMYNYVQRNARSWGVLKILSAYEEMKKANDFLTQALRILHTVTISNNKLKFADIKQPGTNNRQDNSGIAWSYYDDSTF